MNIFELLSEKFILPAKPKLFESFAGIGCQRMAFNRLGIPYESVGISEIDKYAIASYMAIHGDTKNYGDICKINGHELPSIDIFTYSFPCTDLSKAGAGRGMGTHKERTRSGLVYEVLRILHELQDLNNMPKVLIMENVVDLVQAKFIRQFQEIQLELEQMGYSNFAQVINGKDMGVAQNRERIFMVSILGDYYYEFPKPFKLEKRLKDYLETKVDEKYYLSEKLLNCFIENSKKMEEIGNGFRFSPKSDEDIANRLTTKTSDRMEGNFYADPLRLGGVFDKDDGNHQAGSIWDTKGVSPTIDTMQGGHRQPCIIDDAYKNRDERIYEDYSPALRADREGLKVIEPEIINPLAGKSEFGWHFEQNVYDEKGITRALKASEGSGNRPKVIEEPTICASRGRPNEKGFAQELELGEPGLSNTLTTVQKDNMVVEPICLNSKVDGKQPSLQDRVYDSEGIATAITTAFLPSIQEPKLKKELNIYESGGQNGNVYDVNGLCPTISSGGTDTIGNGGVGSSNAPKIIEEPTIRIPEATDGDGVYLNRPHQKRGCVQDGMIQTLKTTSGQDIGTVTKGNNGLRIRKLTPLECWALMGIDESDFRKAEQVCSNSQLYKQAGNGIIVDVFAAIIKQML